MGDTSGGGWSAGKIILAIVGGCFVLTGLCCTGTYFSNQEEFHEAFSFMGEAVELGVQMDAGSKKFETA